jgi:putative transposase
VPQGRGKIERFFRTVRSQFFSGFKGDTIHDINEALECWIRDVYHQRKHLGTGQAPMQRFTSKMECVRLAHADLKDYFRKRATRRVALDLTVSLAGRLCEAPVPLIGKQIILLYHDHNPDRVEVLLGNRSHGLLRPLDLAVNCRAKRDHHLLRLESSSTTAPTDGSLFSQKPDPEVSNS